MKRLLLTLEYEGTNYSGWQRQQNGPGVQEQVEKALKKVLGKHTGVTGASRTDAGVHALGQRAHFDTKSGIPAEKWPYVLNTLLPYDIRAVQCLEVPDSLHARFSAAAKTYRYRVFNRRHNSALERNFAAFVPLPLDLSRMRCALPSLVGTHDFAAFQAAGGSAKTTVRTIHAAEISKEGDELVLFISGNAFLYNMVRIIAGTLIQIGLGKLDENAFETAINSGGRLALGATAPACGLTLMNVSYEGLP